jgi:hypothetical protein
MTATADRRIGRHQLEQVIGTGGFATVRARSTSASATPSSGDRLEVVHDLRVTDR